MRKIVPILVTGLLLTGAHVSGSARAGPPDQATAEYLGPYSIVATTCGAGGREGWDGTYRCRGTVGQPLPGGSWGTVNRTLYAGFWTLLLRGGYLPVAVELASFTADCSGDEVVLHWKVAGTTEPVGFHVYRQTNGGPRQRLTPEPLTGRTEYEYRDWGDRGTGTQYWLAGIERTGRTTWFGPADVSPAPVSPGALELPPPVPNPLVSMTEVVFSLPRNEWVCLEVFDIRGRLVVTVLNETRPAGRQAVTWNGSGANGARLASGSYVLKLTTGDDVRTQKLIVAR